MKKYTLLAFASIMILFGYDYAVEQNKKVVPVISVAEGSPEPFLIKGEIPCPTGDTWPLTTTVLNIDKYTPFTIDPTSRPINALTVNNLPFNPELIKKARKTDGCTILISFHGFVVKNERGLGYSIEFDRWADEAFIKAEQDIKALKTTEELLNEKRWDEALVVAPDAYKDQTNRVTAFLKEYDNCINAVNSEAERCFQQLLDRQGEELSTSMPFSNQFVQGLNEKLGSASKRVEEEKQRREAKEALEQEKLSETELDRRLRQKQAKEKELDRRIREKEKIEKQRKKRDKESVQKAPDRDEEKRPSEQKHETFDITPEQFRVSFNEITSKIDPSYTITKLDIESGPINDTFQHTMDERLGLVGTVNKADGLLKALTVITTGGPSDEAVKILSVMVSSAQALNPNSNNGNIITKLTTAAFDNFNSGVDKSEQERVGDCLYTATVSELGLWFTISKFEK